MGIRKALRETGKELGQGISEAKKFVRSRARVPRRVGRQPPLAFALAPPPFVAVPKRVARPRRIKKRRR